jgi:hypothetical protein
MNWIGLTEYAARVQRHIGLLRRSSITSLLISGFFLAAVLLAFRPGYAVNDDIKMIALVAGYPTGGAVPFLIFSNVLLGFILVPLYRLPTSLNWTVFLFILVQFIAVWVLLQLILSSSLDPRHKRFGTVAVLVCEGFFVLNITFTTTASFACLAGTCVLLSALRSSTQYRYVRLVVGATLLLIGSLIRFEMVLIAVSLAGAAAVLAYRMFDIRRLMPVLAMGILPVLGGYLFNFAYVRAFPEWRAYDLYNNTRSLIQDTHRVENLGRSVRRIGWSANDQELFVRWYLPYAETYSQDKLQFLVDHVSRYSANPAYTLMSVPQAPFGPVLLPYLLVIVAVCLWMHYHMGFRFVVLPLLALWCACVLENAYFIWAWKLADRILLSTISTTAVLGLMIPMWLLEDRRGAPRQLPSTETRPRWALSGAALFLLASVALMLIQSGLTAETNTRKQKDYQQVMTDLAALKRQGTLPQDALIVSPGHGIPLEWASPWLLQFPTVAYLDMNWLTFSPAYEAVLRVENIDDLTAALYQRNNVFLMTRVNILPYIRRAYEEHGGIQAQFQTLYAMPNPDHIAGYEGVYLFKVTASN